MKKKTRKITVEGQIYTWMVSAIDPNFVCLRVWSSEVKSFPWIMVRYRFDDPWLHYGELINAKPEQINEHFQLKPIRPSLVAQIIIKAEEYTSTESDEIRKTLHYQCTSDGHLEAIEDVMLKVVE